MTEKMTLALIYGSARQGRFCDTVASWLIRELEASDVFSLTIIDPVRMKSARGDKPAQPAEWMERKVAEADAFIVIHSRIQPRLPGSAEGDDRCGL